VAIALDPPPLCPLASLSVLSLPPGERRNQKLGKLIGYLCINDFNKNSTLEFIRNLYAHCEFLKYKNKLIKEYKTFVPSPLCIDVSYRGTPLFLNLSMAAMNHISADYNLGLTIISENNSRSLTACKGIGFEEISEFRFKNNCVKILACEFS
jgi:hypothetical protein